MLRDSRLQSLSIVQMARTVHRRDDASTELREILHSGGASGRMLCGRKNALWGVSDHPPQKATLPEQRQGPLLVVSRWRQCRYGVSIVSSRG
jgi:hypothetical protein